MYLEKKKKGKIITELAKGIDAAKAAFSKSVEFPDKCSLTEKTHEIGRKDRRTTVVKLKQ